MTGIIALCVAVIAIRVADSHIKIAMQITSSLFWYFARHRLLVTDLSGQDIGPVFFTGQASTLKMEPLGCPNRRSPTTDVRCVMSHKRENLVYTLVEA
jgi:hypothetical protein